MKMACTGTDKAVFTYGTLQIPEVMSVLTGKELRSSHAILENYECYGIKHRIYPGLLKSQGKTVSGTVYFSVDQKTLELLDAFEDSCYARQSVQVYCENQLVPADTYLYTGSKHKLNTENQWNISVFKKRHLAAYLEQCRCFHRQYLENYSP